MLVFRITLIIEDSNRSLQSEEEGGTDPIMVTKLRDRPKILIEESALIVSTEDLTDTMVAESINSTNRNKGSIKKNHMIMNTNVEALCEEELVYLRILILNKRHIKTCITSSIQESKDTIKMRRAILVTNNNLMSPPEEKPEVVECVKCIIIKVMKQ
jgi:hypothetical protein